MPSASELVAQPASDRVNRLPERAEGGERRLAEVVMQIFDPCDQWSPNLVFKPRARSPTELIDAICCKRGGGGAPYFRMAPCGARGAIGEQVGQHEVAEPRACRGQFVGLFSDAGARDWDE